MPRGKGEPRYSCFCKSCKQTFKAKREDAQTCSAKCRKAWNRLIGGSDDERGKPVTEMPNALYRVLLNGKHVATYPTREKAEEAIHGWAREWDGEFTVKPIEAKGR